MGTHFTTVLDQYLSRARRSPSATLCLVWDPDEQMWYIAHIEQVEEDIDAYRCDQCRIVMWLSVGEAALVQDMIMSSLRGA